MVREGQGGKKVAKQLGKTLEEIAASKLALVGTFAYAVSHKDGQTPSLISFLPEQMFLSGNCFYT